MPARLNVNPTRMEANKLKSRLKTAKRGHKLLKDKSDEMIRQFMILIKQNQSLRTSVEDKLSRGLELFIDARGKMTKQEIENAIGAPSVEWTIEPEFTNVMGLQVPKIFVAEIKKMEQLPYSITSSSISLDKSIQTLSEIFNKIIKLAEIEKTCDMLALEIERLRRRINALEFVLIPQIVETIKYIQMKLAENERQNIVRLMKVKQKNENR